MLLLLKHGCEHGSRHATHHHQASLPPCIHVLATAGKEGLAGPAQAQP